MDRLQELAVRMSRERAAISADHAALTEAQRELTSERDELLRRQEILLDERDTLKVNLHNTFVNLSMRTLSLVERQLALIEDLEKHEQDPEQLESLFRLDHLATRMRRNGENLLVLAGAEAATGQRQPALLIDVLRAASAEIEWYQRVKIKFMPRALVAGRAAADISHLVAELLENAAVFSPPQADVEVSGWVLESGEVMLSVEDHGIGLMADRLAELNEQLADQEPAEDAASRNMGLFVVGRLARRHRVGVRLREMRGGGLTAVVVIPRELITVQEALTGGAPAENEADPSAAAKAPGGGWAGDTAVPRGRPRRPEPVLPGEPPIGPGAGGPAGVREEADPEGTEPDGAVPNGGEHTRPEGDTPPMPVRPAHSGEAVPAPGDQPPAQAPSPLPRRATAPDGSGPAVPAVTRTGLPKRVPQANALPGTGGPSSKPAREGTRAPDGGRSNGPGGVDAAELRRILGSFQQGLQEGRREAETLVPLAVTQPLYEPPGQTPHSSPTSFTPEDGEARG